MSMFKLGARKPTRRELIAVGLAVILVTTLIWTVVDGAGANALTIGSILARQDAAWSSIVAGAVILLVAVWLLG